MSWNMTGTQAILMRRHLSAAASASRPERNRQTARFGPEKVPEYGLRIAHLPANAVRRNSTAGTIARPLQDPMHHRTVRLTEQVRGPRTLRRILRRSRMRGAGAQIRQEQPQAKRHPSPQAAA